jgi:peroxiredoxin
MEAGALTAGLGRRWMLPIPAIMIVDRKGRVAKTFDGDQWIELDAIVDALCECNRTC